MSLTQAPGYVEAFTANSSEVANFKTNEPQFHWNLINRLRRFIRDSEGEAQGWRQHVETLIAERSWEKLQAPDGQPFRNLEHLIQETLQLTAEQFVEEVSKHAGPDMVDLVSPHLGKSYIYQDESERCSAKVAAHKDRQAANAPEIAVRLRANDLITQADMEYLGKLNADEAHQETLQLIEDRIVELDRPPATASETDRRRFRSQVKGIIQHVLPRPEPRTQSKVVRLPNDAHKALALLQEHLDKQQQAILKALICDGATPAKPARKWQRDPAQPKPPDPNAVFPSFDEAVEAVAALNPGEYTTTKNVIVLAQLPDKNTGRVNTRYANGGTIEGNGWKFLKHTSAELVAMGRGPKAASWEVIEYGEG